MQTGPGDLVTRRRSHSRAPEKLGLLSALVPFLAFGTNILATLPLGLAACSLALASVISAARRGMSNHLLALILALVGFGFGAFLLWFFMFAADRGFSSF